MKLGAKIFGTIMVIILVFLLIASFIGNEYIKNSFSGNNQEIALSQAEILARQVNNVVDNKQQLLILLGSFALTDYIDALSGHDAKLLEKKRKEAELRFQVFAEQFDVFSEVRFINAKGDVVIKILNGRIVDEKKENVANETYFTSLMTERFEINKKTMEKLEKSFKDKLSKDKLSRLEKLKNRIFLKDELTNALKELSFTDEEIGLIANHALQTGEKNKKYKYISPLFKLGEEGAINIACLVDYKDENIGVIVATYNLKDIYDMFRDIKFKSAWFAEDSFAWIAGGIEGKPQLISYPEKYKYDNVLMGTLENDMNAASGAILNRKNECIKYISSFGESRMIAVTPVNDVLGWSVAISIPYNTFFSSVEDLQTKLIIVLLVTLLVLTICVFLSVLYFTRSLTKLAVDLNAILEGEQYSKLNVSGNDELSDIAGAFNLLVQKHLNVSHYETPDINPITNLPGNLTVQKRLFDIIDTGNKFAVAMVDIDNFNIYNQRYGFSKGDSVIRMMATLVTNVIKEYGNKEDFIGHLGGDDIVFITTPDKVDKICSEIIAGFDQQILLYYTEEDRLKGGFVWRNKEGAILKFPVMTLSIAVSTNEKRQIIHPLQISQIFSELLVYLKKHPTSMYFKDRRTKERKPLSNEATEKKDDTIPEAKDTTPLNTEGEKKDDTIPEAKDTTPLNTEGEKKDDTIPEAKDTTPLNTEGEKKDDTLSKTTQRDAENEKEDQTKLPSDTEGKSNV